jgi:hypothetical protein
MHFTVSCSTSIYLLVEPFLEISKYFISSVFMDVYHGTNGSPSSSTRTLSDIRASSASFKVVGSNVPSRSGPSSSLLAMPSFPAAMIPARTR